MDTAVPVGVNAFLNAEIICRSGQSVALVTPGSCVVKTIFVKGVDGHTVVHRVHEHTVVGDLLDCTEDVWVTYNGKLVQPGNTIGHIGIGRDDTLRCHGRLRGGAQRYRPQPVDIPGQWTCQACGRPQPHLCPSVSLVSALARWEKVGRLFLTGNHIHTFLLSRLNKTTFVSKQFPNLPCRLHIQDELPVTIQPYSLTSVRHLSGSNNLFCHVSPKSTWRDKTIKSSGLSLHWSTVAMGTSTHPDHCRFLRGDKHPDRERGSPRPSLFLRKVFSCLSQDPLPHRRSDQPRRVEQTSSSGQLRSFCTRSCCGQASRSGSTPSVSLTCHLCPCLFPSLPPLPLPSGDRSMGSELPDAVHVCLARRWLVASLRARSCVVRRDDCRFEC